MLDNKPFWISLALLAAYLLLGYFAGPPVLQPRLEQLASQQLGRDLRFEHLRVDPITWSVQLRDVDLPANEHALWPGLSIRSERVDLRFSFWRLTPVIAELKLYEPRLVLDTENEWMRSGRYPFTGLWQQWREASQTEPGYKPIPVKNWQVDAGQVVIGRAGLPVADVLLDKIFLQAGKQNSEGLRKYSLAFASSDLNNVKLDGLYKPEDLSSSGQYQLVTAKFQQGSMGSFEAEGTFASHFLADEVQVTLTESLLRAEQFSVCMLEGLLCAAIHPMEAGFESAWLAASDGIRLQQIKAQLNGFQLDASMGKGSLQLASQQAVKSAELELSMPKTRLLDTLEAAGLRNFVIKLVMADSDQYRVDGQFDVQSQQTKGQFSVSGRHEMSGVVELQELGPQQAQAAYSRLDLQLNNPQASLVRNFANEYSDQGLEAESLQLQLTASMDDSGLKLLENIRLEQPRRVPSPVPEPAADSKMPFDAEHPAELNTEWLLALLQDPDDAATLEIPAWQGDFSIQGSVADVLQQQALATLVILSGQPFPGLARQFHLPDQQLDEIRFAAGSAALDAANSKVIANLASALVQRPGLGLALSGVYDPLIDNKALQTEQVRTHIALAGAAELSFQSGAEPTDFNDPVVHSVIDEFARRQLPAKVLQSFFEHFGLADVDQGVMPEGDIAAYYATLFELLVDYAEIPQGALTTLARYRAQAVTEGLEAYGVSPSRLQTAAQPNSSDARVEGVPLPLQLRIWQEPEAAPVDDAAPEILPEAGLTTEFENSGSSE